MLYPDAFPFGPDPAALSGLTHWFSTVDFAEFWIESIGSKEAVDVAISSPRFESAYL